MCVFQYMEWAYHQRKSGLFGFSSSEALWVEFSLSPWGESSSCSHSLGPMSLAQMPLMMSSSPHQTSPACSRIIS